MIKRHNIITDYLVYVQRLEQLATTLNTTMDAIFNEMIAQLEAQLPDTATIVQKPHSAPTEWLQVANGEPFGPYDAVRLKGVGASFSEMIVEDRNQT